MTTSPVAQSRNTLEALQRLEKIVLDTLDFRQLVQKICDSILNELYFLDLSYRLVMLALVNEKEGKIEIVANSQTPEAQKAIDQTKIPLSRLEVSLGDTENSPLSLTRLQSTQKISDWSKIFTSISPSSATAAQQASGIQTTLLVPISAKGKTLGVLMFAVAKGQELITAEEEELMEGFSDIVAIAVENARLYSSLDSARGELAVANDKLKELDRLKDEFVSTAAHALRSPMTAIKGYLSMVLEGNAGQITPQAIGFLQGAYEGNDRLIRLVNHMLDISRIESGRLIFNIVPVSLEDIIQSEVDSLKILASQKQLKLEYLKPPSPLPQLQIDPDRLREVINNLVGNAIKFTDQGSIVLSHEEKDGLILTHVTDTGPGISSYDLPNLFQKFTQARLKHGKSGGSGLGLYLSKIIIHEFGGDIMVKSELGKGSTFTISLPLRKS
ncbi:MAG: GAF domain-containing protein [Candidatus Chisholmbacteria bacterium]|nr:GAF domain-containing protein [Candidatus Chisholmbacteria bacterium]